MFVRRYLLCVLLFSAGCAVAAEQYYQVDPAKLAALEASRCAGYHKEVKLIRRRLTSPTNIQSDVDRMKTKLQSLNTSITKYCTAASTVDARR